MGRAGRRLPQQGGLFQARRRGRREGPGAEPRQQDGGAEVAAPTGTGLVSAGGGGAEPGDGSPPTPLWAALQDLGLLQRCVPVQCRQATDEELLMVQSPSLEAKLEPPESPPKGGSRPGGAVGAALALLELLLGGTLRNGVVLLSPEDPLEPPQAVAVAARVAQKHLGGQRILIVDWSPHPGQTLPSLFKGDPSVLYFGVHQSQDPPPDPDPEGGLRVELHWEQTDVTDGDYAAAAFHLLLPIAFQFQPQLVLVKAVLGDHPGSLGVSPEGLSLLTHLLMALAGGRLLVVLQGGPDLGASLGGVGAVLRTLLGDPRDPLGPISPSPSGLATIAHTLSVQRRFWSCLDSAESEEEEEEEEEEEDEEEEAEAAVGEEEEEEDEEEEEKGEGDGDPPETPLGTPPETPPGPRVGLVYDPRMEEHRNTWDSQHPECPQRLPRVLQRLQELGFAQRCLWVPPRPAAPHALRAVHSRAHVRTLARTPELRPRELRALSQRYNSLYLCPQSYPCARLAAGGACEAVSAVLRGQVRSALAVLRPPGHHARRGSAGGFCLFNNVGVAVRHAQRLAGTPLRVLILDWDVHHGNGTQEIFEEDPSVLYISLHRHDGSFFPGGSGGSPRRRGRGLGLGFTLNVGWGGPRVGDPEYLAAVTRLVLPVACQFAPQLVLVSAGFDAGRGDPLGGCLVSPQTFGLMTHLLGGLAGGRLVLVLEGGYNLGVTAEGVGQCLGVLLGDPPTLPPPGTPQPTALRALSRTLRAHRGSWSCLRLPRVEPPPVPPKGEEGIDDVTLVTDDVTRVPDDVTRVPDDVTPPLDAAISRLGALQLGEPPGGGAKAAEGAEPPPDPAHVGVAEAGAAAAPCWAEEEEELEEGALFAVTPLPECPHLGAVAPPPPPGGALGGSRPPPCGICGSRRENWLCLSCYRVLCGRYVGGHMLEHEGLSGHPLVLSLRDLAVWCYPCGGYVMNPVLLPAKTLIYRLKFGTDPPTASF